MTGTHTAIFALSLLGFAGLAIGTHRYAPLLVGFVPPSLLRRTSWWFGWLALAAALLLALLGLQTVGLGIVFWLGWLTLAGVALAFVMPSWPWRRREAARPAREPRAKAGDADPVPLRQPRRWIGWLLCAVTLTVFFALLLGVETKPLLRDDAVQGKVGPWSFTFAESDRDPPELVDMGVPIKTYSLRFCEACDLEITRAYLKVNKPRALRAAGMAFEGNSGERHVEIQIPSNLGDSSELWLTVVGKSGAVHQVAWPVKTISPATLAWSARQENK